MKKFVCLPAMILATVASFGQALTLDSAINVALKNSLDLQLAKNNVAISALNNNPGVAGALPLVTASGSDLEQTTNVNQELNTGTIIKRNGAIGNAFTSNITGGILLYNGLRVLATRSRLAQLQLQSEQVLNSQVQNTMAAVMISYYDIVRQQSYLTTIDTSLAVAQHQLDIVKVQQNVGMANNSDLFQSQINLNSLLQQKQAQQLVIDQAKTGLLLLLNVRPDSLITVRDSIRVDQGLILGDILNSVDRNADILAADDQVRINELIVRETAALRYPSLNAYGGYNFNRSRTSAGNVLLNQLNGPFAQVTLGIPIYNGSAYKRAEKVAVINVENAGLQKDILLRNYRAHAVQTYQAYLSALQQLDSQKVNMALAQKLVDLVLQRFQLHAATMIELIQAEQSFENAAYTLMNVTYAAKSSEIELKRLVNRLSL